MANTENNVKSDSVSLSEADGEHTHKQTFTLEELYSLSVKFFREKEGSRALQISYKDKQQLVALTKQVTYGPYKMDQLPSVGLLDVIGNDRRLAWSSLGEMSKDEAMQKFINVLQSLSPLLEPYIEAHRTKKEEELKKSQEEHQKEELKCLEEAVRQQQEQQQRSQLEELQIRNALNQQTAVQFKVYAEQQYPGDIQQQQALIAQLQEQHFIQYMQKLYQHQQQLMQLQQQYILQQQQQQMTHPDSQQQQQHDHNVQKQQQLGEHQDQKVQQQQQQLTVNNENAQQQQQFTHQNYTQQLNQSEQRVLQTAVGQQLTERPVVDNDTHLLQNGGRQYWQQTNDDDLPPIAAASMWVRKDTKEFKQTLSKEPDCVIKVGSGEMVTIRVPTHDDGSCLFWEFTTDSYDVGFGVYFEWSSSKQTVSHASESTDDEDDNEADKPTTSDNPVEEIIPVYRRDSHLEIQCGSHIYPGRGTYLLKFDNSYSLWRSKTLYYRVYYTK